MKERRIYALRQHHAKRCLPLPAAREWANKECAVQEKKPTSIGGRFLYVLPKGGKQSVAIRKYGGAGADAAERY